MVWCGGSSGVSDLLFLKYRFGIRHGNARSLLVGGLGEHSAFAWDGVDISSRLLIVEIVEQLQRNSWIEVQQRPAASRTTWPQQPTNTFRVKNTRKKKRRKKTAWKKAGRTDRPQPTTETRKEKPHTIFQSPMGQPRQLIHSSAARPTRWGWRTLHSASLTGQASTHACCHQQFQFSVLPGREECSSRGLGRKRRSIVMLICILGKLGKAGV
ncbi:hypothetical protein BD289DRAFT_252862 [Coniella lustricola]|uniref:Uncharacterized protein n=1 Tax=Coniella lustricola TaxID=2025994 RepID=A0A2T3A8D2_9PEZI|nr:hypothetical protein BD289DRAFT_252862 [Coniella lustricola]